MAELIGNTITYDADENCGEISGRHLTRGVPTEVNGIKVVEFQDDKKNRKIYVRYESRPELAKVVDEYFAQVAKLEAEWQAEHDAKAAADKILTDKMHAKAAEIAKEIPAGNVRVTVTQTGDLDGYPILKYEVDGVELKYDDVVMHGSAEAVREGAWGAFETEYVASISAEKLTEIISEKEIEKIEKAAAREAREKELAETPIPQSAIILYEKFHGDPDAAYEDEGYGAQGAIELAKWIPYIEAQRGMDKQKFSRLITEANCEANYGIKD